MPRPGKNELSSLAVGIERWAPRPYRQERERLFKRVRRDLGDDVCESMLVAVQVAHESAGRTEAEGRHLREYWKRRRRLTRQLEEIACDDLVRAGPDFLSVVFYEPHEVDCPHARRAKKCVEIRGKLEQLHALKGLLATIAPTNPVRGSFERRVGQLREEINALDTSVSPEKATPADFCSETFREIADGRVLAEAGGATWHHARPGRPVHSVQRYLLESVGELIYGRKVSDKSVTRRNACKIVADILEYCFDAKDIDAEGLERRWREVARPSKPLPKKQPTSRRSRPP
jgi:hypothetical protein